MEILKTEINALVNASMAQKTWKTYKTAVESFKTFRSLYLLRDVWPVPVSDVVYYIAYLSYTGLSSSTILTYVSDLSYAHKLHSYTHKLHSLEDNTKSFLVGKLLEGLRLKKPQKSYIRLTISISLVKRLI
jgi:site-specific recombinase XerD